MPLCPPKRRIAGSCPKSAACNLRPALRTSARPRARVSRVSPASSRRIPAYVSTSKVTRTRTGSLATNNELSLRRASAVREYLIGQGIAPERIDVAGLGPSRPIEDNSTDQGRARNRRVEIVLSGGPLAADAAEGEALRAARN